MLKLFKKREHLDEATLQAVANVLEQALTQTHLDNWQSSLGGNLGNPLMDKARMVRYVMRNRLTYEERNAIWRESGIAKRIISLPAEDMTREGVNILHPRGDELEESIDWNHIKLVLEEDRAHGQACLLLNVNDGQRLDQPVNPLSIRNVGLHPDLRPVVPKRYIRPKGGSKQGVNPEVYTITVGGTHHDFHRDRLLMFNGIYAGEENWHNNLSTGEAVFDMIRLGLENFNMDYNAGSTTVKDFNQPVYRLKNFAKMLTGTGASAATSAMEQLKTMDKIRSMVNAIVMGVDDEFIQQNKTVTGLAELIRLSKEFLCILTGIPHNILFGESPGSSLGESGGSQNRIYYDMIRGLQNTKLKPELLKWIRYKAAELRIDIVNIPLKLIFNPLWQPTEKERGETYNIVLGRSESLFEKGLMTAKEVRSHFTSDGGFSVYPTLDPDFEKQLETLSEIPPRD